MIFLYFILFSHSLCFSFIRSHIDRQSPVSWFSFNIPLVSLSFDTPCHPLLLLSARCFVGTLWLPTQQGLCSQLPVDALTCMLWVSPLSSLLSVPLLISLSEHSSSSPLLFLILLPVVFGVTSQSDPQSEASWLSSPKLERQQCKTSSS